jgi:hypothetical protein
MDKDEYIKKVLAHIKNKAFVNTIKQELENHITDREEYYTEIGYDEKFASKKAIEHMGNADIVGEELNLLHDYKKHKIICIIALIVFILHLILLRYFNGIFSIVLNDYVPMLSVCIATILEYIVYKYAFVSRSRIVMLLQGIACIFAGMYFTSNLNFTWIANVDFENLASTLFAIFEGIMGLIFIINGNICITCSGEISALISGKYNDKIIKRYEKYIQFLFSLTIICATATIIFFKQ